MVGGGVLIAGAVTAGLGPIAFVCGVLMLWSGIIKAIVLGIWRANLPPETVPDQTRLNIDSEPAIGQRS